MEMAAYTIHISVGEPIQHTTSFGSYTSYKVTTSTNHPSFSFPEISVCRRYSDFLWIHNQLSFYQSGCIIPPLPVKQVLNRFEHNFIKRRIYGLESFLNKCSKHNEIFNSSHFLAFLQLDDAGLETAKSDSKRMRENRARATGMADWIDMKVHSLMSNKRVPQTEEDGRCEELKLYLTELEKCIKKCLEFISAMIKCDQEMSVAVKNFGASFTTLAQEEGYNVNFMVTKLGDVTEGISKKLVDVADDESIQVKEKLYFLLLMIEEGKRAIVRRDVKKRNYIDASIEVESKQLAYNKIVETNASGVQDKLSELQKCQNVANEEKDLFEKMSVQLLDDFDAFKLENSRELTQIINNLMTSKVTHAHYAFSQWNILAEPIDDVFQALEVIKSEKLMAYTSSLKSEVSTANNNSTDIYVTSSVGDIKLRDTENSQLAVVQEDGNGNGGGRSGGARVEANENKNITWKSNTSNTITSNTDDDIIGV